MDCACHAGHLDLIVPFVDGGVESAADDAAAAVAAAAAEVVGVAVRHGLVSANERGRDDEEIELAHVADAAVVASDAAAAAAVVVGVVVVSAAAAFVVVVAGLGAAVETEVATPSVVFELELSKPAFPAPALVSWLWPPPVASSSSLAQTTRCSAAAASVVSVQQERLLGADPLRLPNLYACSNRSVSCRCTCCRLVLFRHTWSSWPCIRHNCSWAVYGAELVAQALARGTLERLAVEALERAAVGAAQAALSVLALQLGPPG